jgi:hypothetical protein
MFVAAFSGISDLRFITRYLCTWVAHFVLQTDALLVISVAIVSLHLSVLRY